MGRIFVWIGGGLAAVIVIGALLFAFIVLQKGLLRIAEGGARG